LYIFIKIIFLFLFNSFLFGNEHIKQLYNMKEIELKRIDLYINKMNNLIKLENDIKNIILNKFKRDTIIISNLLLINPSNHFISKIKISNNSTKDSQDYIDFINNFGYKSFLNDNIITRINSKRFFFSDSPIFIDYNNKGFEICNILGETIENKVPNFVKDFYLNNTNNRTGEFFFNNYNNISIGPNQEKELCIFYLYPSSLKEETKSNSKIQKLGIETFFSDECKKVEKDNQTILIKDGPTLKVGVCKNSSFNYLRTLGKIPNKFIPSNTLDNNNLDTYNYPSSFIKNNDIDLLSYSNQFNYESNEFKEEYNIFHFISRNNEINKPNFIGGNYSFDKLPFANKGSLYGTPLSSLNIKYPYKIFLDDYQEALYLKEPCTNHNINNNCTIFNTYLESYYANDQNKFPNSNLNNISNGYIYNNSSISIFGNNINDEEHQLSKQYNLFFGKKNRIDKIYNNSVSNLSFKNLFVDWNKKQDITDFGSFSNPFFLNFEN